MSKPITRRLFMRQSASAALFPLILPRLSLGESANGRLNLGAIGVGGRGRADLLGIMGTNKVDVVALCDVDENTLNGAAQAFPNARTYRDWREMLAQEGDRMDAVSVGTPDHMHAAQAMGAIRLGKHVYCEKPLTHEVYEARQLTIAAREAMVVTQMGIQIHAHNTYRKAVKALRDGAIGKVKEWHSWSNATYSSPGMTRPEGEDPVPAWLDWNQWIGVAPMRPYKEKTYHPGSWRSWRDFGCGAMGDFGCHIFDPVFTALEIGAPLTILGEAPEQNDEVWPYWGIVHYEFPGTKWTAEKTIRATWYDSGKKPPRELAPLPEGIDLPDSGSLLLGEDGVMVLPHYEDARLYPVEKYAHFVLPSVEPENHFRVWVDGCLEGKPATCDFAYSGPLAETILLGNVATRLAGKTLEWDSASLAFKNAPEADALVRRTYREGWSVEGLG
ncbi:MAG TPA: Gfo/Idh/MocA family oxidoreductase [Candidatus Hydrogenedentes bacterium]|nr:Gfo/Idh/MocA family oxidoreductase [Candidatus Hydrogenedentota bacterium]HPG67387.1 Gfo/Idh/MocA family oxidoreductase [Candidatus Hydrogenedentota bacterium]